MSTYLSPDCRDGNCIKCDGTAWDLEQDQVTHCAHDCHQDHGHEAAAEAATFDPGPPWKLLGTTESGFRVFTAPAGVAIPGTGNPPRISER